MTNKLCTAPSSQPKFPITIKNSSNEDVVCADPKATRALVAIMDMYSVIGGAASHWGGPAALAEGMSALHALMFKESQWFDHYNFINDVGHAENGIYALRANLGYGDLKIEDLKKFRSIESKLTGHGESHLYPEGVLLSNGPLGSSIGQAQGLAMSDKLKNQERITISVISDGACMEGEAKESLAAIPGLKEQNKIAPFVLIISDNNTKLSGRIDSDSFSMAPTFKSLSDLGWDTRIIEEGNDLQSCYLSMEQALKDSKNAERPIALVLKTIKGYGVSKTEKSASGGHGFPLKPDSKEMKSFINEIYNNNTPDTLLKMAAELDEREIKPKTNPGAPKDKIQAGFSKAMIDLKNENYPIVAISSDLQGSTGAAAFHKEFPKNSFDIGIAESNMVSVAAGFSKNGYIPVVDTFAAFGVTKGNLPMIMARLSDCPMIALFTHTGMQDAADGASHQSTTYFSAMASIPGVKVVCPSTKDEAEFLLKAAIKDINDNKNKNANSYVFFAGREAYPHSLEASYSLSKASVIEQGSDLTLVATGPMVHFALRAAKELRNEQIQVEVINHSQVNYPDTKTIGESITKTGKVLTIEDHQIIGGMGSLLIHSLKTNGYEFKAQSMGINNHFGRSAYSAEELYNLFNIGVKDIVENVKTLLD